MIKIIGFMLSTIFLFVGCTMEDLSQCTKKMKVGIKFRSNVQFEEHTRPITRIDLYTFDEDGVCVGKFSDHDLLFNENYTMYAYIEPGRYTFVAWVNYNDTDYTVYSRDADKKSPIVIKSSLMSNMQLSLAHPEKPITGQIGDLFHAMVRDVEVKDVGDIKDVLIVNMPLTKDANTIRVTLKNPENARLPKSRTASRLTVEIAADNGAMNFSNEIVSPSVLCQHKPYSAQNNDYEHTVLRMQIGRSMIVRVLDIATGLAVFEGDIIDMIIKADNGISTNEDLDRISLFEVTLEFGVDSEVKVVINGWEIEEPETDLG